MSLEKERVALVGWAKAETKRWREPPSLETYTEYWLYKLAASILETEEEKKELVHANIPKQSICFCMNGNSWCCFRGDFVNLQESPAGFGDTREEAEESLKISEAKDKEFKSPGVGAGVGDKYEREEKSKISGVKSIEMVRTAARVLTKNGHQGRYWHVSGDMVYGSIRSNDHAPELCYSFENAIAQAEDSEHQQWQRAALDANLNPPPPPSSYPPKTRGETIAEKECEHRNGNCYFGSLIINGSHVSGNDLETFRSWLASMIDAEIKAAEERRTP